jgi:hypothetical protein
VRLATTGFMVSASTRVPDALAMRVIATKLRSKLLAQADVRDRLFMQGILHAPFQTASGCTLLQS